MSQATIERPIARPALATASTRIKAAPAMAIDQGLSEILNQINNRVYSCKAIITMLIYVYGGEMEKDNRPTDSEAFGLYRTLYASAIAIRELGKQKEFAFPLPFWDAVYANEAITQTLESILSDNDLENPFGDTTMDGLFMAMKTSLGDIAASIAPLFTKP